MSSPAKLRWHGELESLWDREEVNVNPAQAMEIRIKVVCTSLCRRDITAW
ncbi:hypothetical protein Pyn_07965 [Prunus yedoensis var. nudiflora]|uniref:Alcohol dehydrogenase n=1 Tax=Prunus yedoensis var. nudiflora TaxID=2094558 RepID=A0A314YJS5_PRUYE|nr:hypothetical protein Pyn_07965 [Prunus yedoensis var. nudiflora]